MCKWLNRALHCVFIHVLVHACVRRRLRLLPHTDNLFSIFIDSNKLIESIEHLLNVGIYFRLFFFSLHAVVLISAARHTTVTPELLAFFHSFVVSGVVVVVSSTCSILTIDTMSIWYSSNQMRKISECVHVLYPSFVYYA